jgi:DNA-binding XRE family transcriptional regulator
MSKQQPAFYTRLRLVRTERNLSRQQLADAVGVHYQTIGYIERGDYTPSLELALRLARHFDLPVEALFSLDPFAPLDARALTGGHANRGDDGQRL